MLRIWDLRMMKNWLVCEGHTNDVLSVRFSPDGQQIVSGSKDKTVRVWDIEQHKEVYCLTGHKKDVNDCCFSPDGRTVASVSSDNFSREWRLGELVGMESREGTVHEPDMLALQSAPRAAAHVLPRRQEEQAKAEAWAKMVQQLEDEWAKGVANGLTCDAAVNEMKDNIAKGRFSTDHYLEMWTTRNAEHDAAQAAEAAAAQAEATAAECEAEADAAAAEATDDTPAEESALHEADSADSEAAAAEAGPKHASDDSQTFELGMEAPEVPKHLQSQQHGQQGSLAQDFEGEAAAAQGAQANTPDRYAVPMLAQEWGNDGDRQRDQALTQRREICPSPHPIVAPGGMHGLPRLAQEFAADKSQHLEFAEQSMPAQPAAEPEPAATLEPELESAPAPAVEPAAEPEPEPAIVAEPAAEPEPEPETFDI